MAGKIAAMMQRILKRLGKRWEGHIKHANSHTLFIMAKVYFTDRKYKD
jgi:hypothetical protein